MVLLRILSYKIHLTKTLDQKRWIRRLNYHHLRRYYRSICWGSFFKIAVLQVLLKLLKNIYERLFSKAEGCKLQSLYWKLTPSQKVFKDFFNRRWKTSILEYLFAGYFLEKTYRSLCHTVFSLFNGLYLKKAYILKQTFRFQLQLCLSMHNFLVPLIIKELN